jgi:hypothetical protein
MGIYLQDRVAFLPTSTQSRAPVALRATVMASGIRCPFIITHLGEDAVCASGPTRRLCVGEEVLVRVELDDEAPLLLPACVHRNDRGKAVLWLDRIGAATRTRLSALVLCAHAGHFSRGGLFHYLHAA